MPLGVTQDVESFVAGTIGAQPRPFEHVGDESRRVTPGDWDRRLVSALIPAVGIVCVGAGGAASVGDTVLSRVIGPGKLDWATIRSHRAGPALDAPWLSALAPAGLTTLGDR